MSNIMFMFPGVGSHYSGMGKYFYENFKIARETFEEASDVLNIDFPKMCFSKENSNLLNELENSQAALVCVCMATYRVLMQETGLKPKYCIGYSLGEYTALCSAGVIQYADTLKLVRNRGLIIKEVSSKIDGTMAWTVNLEAEIVDDICKEFQLKGYKVYMSACDCYDKASISATSDVLMKVGERIVEKGGILVPIKMSGPYHSPLMWEAEQKLKAELQKYTFGEPQYTVLSNRNADAYVNGQDVVENLSLQLVQPVQWKKTLDKAIKQGGEIAIEIGPKNVLTYLLKRNCENIACYSVDTEKDFSNLCSKLFVSKNECNDIVSKCLVAVTSTRNYNFDTVQYNQKVVAPYRELLNTYQQLISGNVVPDISYAKDAVETLESILKAKGINFIERGKKMKWVLGGKLFRTKETIN